jgi:allantoinase
VEPDRFDYSPIVDRPLIKWPNDARIAVFICPNVSYYEYTPPPNKFRNPWPRSPHPDVRSYSHQDYGNRIGFWRMLDVLDKHRVKCTTSLNVAVLEHFPEIRDAMVERDWDYMSHGIYNTRFIFGYSEEEERSFYRDVIDTVRQYTGKRPLGTLGPGPQSSTVNTPDLMAEAGFLYHADWYHDDQPFPIKVKSGRLISLPYSLEINDSPFLGTAWEADDFLEVIKRQFDQLYAEGSESGRVLCISLHAYLTGQPHRIKYLDEAISYIVSHDQVWLTTAADIAEYYLANYYDQVVLYAQQRQTREP